MLAGAAGFGAAEAGRAITAEIRDDNAMAECGQAECDGVEAARVVGEAMQEDDAGAGCGAVGFIGGVQDAGDDVGKGGDLRLGRGRGGVRLRTCSRG